MRVLLTGGTGYLGRGWIRRFYGHQDITVLSRDEYKQMLCRERWPQVTYVLGDVNNYARLCNTLSGGYDLVVHMAAVKFIPEAELNVLECIDINVGGTNNVLQACGDTGVQRCVVISTDKACAPLNVYGMTKALAERMVGEYARYANGCVYTACRYGNVVGSTGSVIPAFKRQLQENDSITITDPDMTRYWISVDQAIDLILDATKAANGDIVIPTPASMRIGDIARLFTRNINITGRRPGEKMHESLMHEQESVRSEYDFKNYILHQTGIYSEPFMLSSNNPKVWLRDQDMLNMIKDAELV